MNQIKTPEVLSPGGSMAQALRGLEGGAKAVYVGTERFSARAHAHNLSLDEIAALSQKASESGAKVYAALNTIMTGTELPQAVGLAWELHWRGVAAIIVQDLGLARALRRHGPPLDLHASTQAAIHSPEGARALSDMGFSRVVMARELTLDEIAACVQAVPSLEYEVFVHGALCYAASGLCMASGIELGRSANRGDCGQLCRTWFTDTKGEDLFVASMNDLSLGSRVRELRDIGVESFKIEGRMKPPPYAYWASRAYALFLEGGKDTEAWSCLDEARLSFGRNPTTAYLDGPKSQGLVNNRFSQSTGLPAGTVTAVEGSLLTLRLDRDIAVGDGLLILREEQVHKGLQAQRFAVKSLSLQGRKVNRAEKGKTVVVEGAGRPGAAMVGTPVLLASRHDGKMPDLSTRGSWRHPVALGFRVLGVEAGTLSLEISSPDLGGHMSVKTFPAMATRNPDPQGSAFKKAVESVWLQSASAWLPSSMVWHPGTDVHDLFVSPGELKEARRQWYQDLDVAAAAFLQERIGAAGMDLAALPAPGASAPPRGSLSPRGSVNGRIGFVTDWDSLTLEDLALHDGFRVLPLAPFVLEPEPLKARPLHVPYRERLLAFLARHGDQDFLLGLSNPAHLDWIRGLVHGGRIDCWLDYGFHAASPSTQAAVQEALDTMRPGTTLRFAIPWLEGRNLLAEGAPPPDTTWKPPYFISRACMLRNSLGKEKPECPRNCSGHFRSHLTQGEKEFDVLGVDCITYLLRS